MTKSIKKSIWKSFRGWILQFIKAAVIKYLPLSKEKIMWTWINKNKEKGADSRTVLETELIGLSGHLCDTVSLIQQHGRRVRWWMDMLRWRFLWDSQEVMSGSVQFSCSVVSDSLRPHGLQHARLPCPSQAPRAHSNSSPLSWWCHPTISSSVIRFSSCLQSFPASGSFLRSHLFASGGQSIGISASVLPVNIQDWLPLGWTGWISLQSKGLSRVFFNTTVQRHQCFETQLSL